MPDASNTCEGDGRGEDERVVPPPSVATQDVSCEDDEEAGQEH